MVDLKLTHLMAADHLLQSLTRLASNWNNLNQVSNDDHDTNQQFFDRGAGG